MSWSVQSLLQALPASHNLTPILGAPYWNFLGPTQPEEEGFLPFLQIVEGTRTVGLMVDLRSWNAWPACWLVLLLALCCHPTSYSFCPALLMPTTQSFHPRKNKDGIRCLAASTLRHRRKSVSRFAGEGLPWWRSG